MLLTLQFITLSYEIPFMSTSSFCGLLKNLKGAELKEDILWDAHEHLPSRFAFPCCQNRRTYTKRNLSKVCIREKGSKQKASRYKRSLKRQDAPSAICIHHKRSFFWDLLLVSTLQENSKFPSIRKRHKYTKRDLSKQPTKSEGSEVFLPLL